MIATLTEFGINSNTMWYFAVGILTVLFVVCLIVMGISLIKSLIDQ